MKFSVAFVSVLLLVAQATASAEEGEGRYLKAKKKLVKANPVLVAAKKCKLTPSCERIGGTATTRELCAKMPDYQFLSNHDFGGDPTHPDTNSNCGCCFKKESNPVDAKSIIAPYFQLESISMGTPGTFENIFDERTRVGMQLLRDEKEGLQVGELTALFEDSNTVWGFSSAKQARSPVECDGKGICKSQIRGQASSAFLEKLLPGETYDDVNVGRTVDAIIEVRFEDPKMNSELQRFLENKNIEEHFDTSGIVQAELKLIPSKDLSYLGLQSIFLRTEFPIITSWRWIPVLPIDIYPSIVLYERKRNLCVQPVRVRTRECAFSILGICFKWDYHYSGSGLAFGQPGAEEQWGKVDVTFTWKSWKTIIDNDGKYKYVTESEMSSLKSEIEDDPCCIEVFFVDHFSPSDTYGGGATWGSGTAGAQIVTSDEQVSCGVDTTHLAHELGHVLGLMHPGTGSATYADGSTGTLMCASGWERDNPRRNSRDNGNNIVNPLLVTYYGSWTFSSPDCTSSSDCGSCSAHYPSDSC